MLVATPIGNLGDLSPRAASELTEAALWIVEDTRVSARLQAHLGLKRPMRVVNDHTADGQVQRLVDDIATMRVALITDGGAPAISDPGARVVDLAVARGIEIDAIPGPSAVTTALMLSGFYAQRFAFLGFMPRKPGPIREIFEPFADSSMTLVLFESPHRVGATLRQAGFALGSRRFAACREMTKLHQEVVRGELGDEAVYANLATKGEYCLVIEGKRRRQGADNRDVLE